MSTARKKAAPSPSEIHYLAGCKAGEIEAEQYLQSLRDKPELAGMPLAGSSLRGFGVFPADDEPFARGQLVGFLARVEVELSQPRRTS